MFQHRSFLVIAVQLVFVFFVSTPLVAQSFRTYGKLTGIVCERSGAVNSQIGTPVAARRNHEQRAVFSDGGESFVISNLQGAGRTQRDESTDAAYGSNFCASLAPQTLAAAGPQQLSQNNSSRMPDAPLPQREDKQVLLALATSPFGQATESEASIAGTVLDAHEAAIAGVQVTLAGQNNAVHSVVTVDSKGAFTFSGLLPGTYRVMITLPGKSPSVAAEVLLRAGEKRDLPIITSGTPTSSTTVYVTANVNQVAEAQVKEAEKQRVFGVFPNFYTSYIWNSAPMTPKLKFHLALRSTIDPVSILVASGVAGAEQWHNTFPGYGSGWQGYGQRFGAAYADTAVSAFVSRAIFPTVFHQDPRYFFRGSGSVHSRVLYAIEQTFVARGDDGRREANYSHLLGNFVTAGISNIYRAPSDRSVSLTFRDGLIVTGANAVGNLLREFLSRPLTTNVPAFAKGKR